MELWKRVKAATFFIIVSHVLLPQTKQWQKRGVWASNNRTNKREECGLALSSSKTETHQRKKSKREEERRKIRNPPEEEEKRRRRGRVWNLEEEEKKKTRRRRIRNKEEEGKFFFFFFLLPKSGTGQNWLEWPEHLEIGQNLTRGGTGVF